MRRIIKTVCATALCAVLLTGCSSPTDEVIKAMAEGNVEQAQQVYAEKISGNSGKESDFRDKAEEALNDLIEQYNNGTLTEEEVDARFEAYKKLLGSEGVYTKKEKKLNELKASKYLFNSANKFLEEGNKKTAYELYDGVEEIDVNYETAQERMKEIEPTVRFENPDYTIPKRKEKSSASTGTKKNQTVTSKTEYKTGSSDVIADGEGKDKYGHDKFDAFVIAENAVKEKLKSPSTAKFCSTTEATIGRIDNTWTVKGWVDAQNGLGATVRANFVVTFTFASKDTYSVALCSVE